MVKEIDKVAWLHVQHGKVLSTRSHGKAAFYLPGGKREPGETDSDCLRREISEELSVTLSEGSLSLAGIFCGPADGQPEGTTVRLTCYRATYEGVLEVGREIAQLDWLSYADRGKCALLDQSIFDWLRERGQIS